ncbi:MAG: hypothetical protein ACYCR7_05355 [Thermoplasmataceae archaeon]
MDDREICEHLHSVKRPWFVSRVLVSDEGKRMGAFYLFWDIVLSAGRRK